MDLKLQNSFFVVTGASSGFGRAITRQLIKEGASVLAVARDPEKLENLRHEFGIAVETLVSDVTSAGFTETLMNRIGDRVPAGLVLNAGGPPSGGFFDASEQAWVTAFHNILLWKVKLLKSLVPVFVKAGNGRILMIESVSVKQPVEGLILSNSFRAAVAGMARTLASEIAGEGVTLNILAPGYHNTAAMQRLYAHKSAVAGISQEDARLEFVKQSGMAAIGEPDDFAELAVWLLSPSSGYITGQVISVAGNLVKGILG